MIYCLNPLCRARLNPEGYKFCQSCGSQLLLRNRYRAIKFLGGGGFGRTYQAIDQDCMNAPCVVKQFSPSLDIQAEPVALRKATEMFNQEAVRLLQLGEHPQIPRLLAYFEQEHLYLVQQLIDGQDLKQELAREGAFSEQKIRQLLADLLPVLKFIHDHGVIHRDIKPGNIMRRRQDGKLILIDFGVSKQATGSLLGKVGTTVGTAGYTPLEQMRGQAYPASDLYSLGVTCVCLLTQFLPRVDGSDEVYNAMEGRWLWREYLPQGTTISPHLGKVLDKLLQDLPKERYQSADEVLQALNSETSNSTTTTPVAVIPSPSECIQPLRNGGDRSKPIRDDEKNLAEISALPAFTLPPSLPIPQPLDAPPPPARLISAVGIDYSKLRQLLAAEKWQEADVESRAILLQVSNREPEGWLRAEDFKNFPCEDLHTIDQLWVKYSKGRFGFSVQKRVWESIDGKLDNNYTTWCRFGDKVGWRVKGNWLNYSDLTFNRETAPLGHLPAGGLDSSVVGKWDLVGLALAARLGECNIE
jgi:serine/threonine protein kinase